MPQINDDSAMDVDSHRSTDRGKKRSAEEEPSQDGPKKARFGKSNCAVRYVN